MRHPLPTLRSLVGTIVTGSLLLTAVGCARPYYYQPPAYPPQYPIQTLTPGTPYVPGAPAPGGPVYPNNTLGAPGSLQPVPADSAPPTYTPDPSGDFQPPTTNNGGSNGGGSDPYFPNNGGSTPNNPAVPNYSDPAFDGGGFNNSPQPGNDFDSYDDFMQPNNGGGGFDSDLNEASAPQALTPAESDIALAAVPNDLPADPMAFASPSTSESNLLPANPFEETPAIEQTGFDAAPMQPAASPSKPYAFDEKAYTWVRGIVGYDAADQTWGITYNVTPDSWDQYAGHFTLSGNVPTDIRDNDVVLVEGSVDADTTDRFGKPVYKITSITALEPVE